MFAYNEQHTHPIQEGPSPGESPSMNTDPTAPQPLLQPTSSPSIPSVPREQADAPHSAPASEHPIAPLPPSPTSSASRPVTSNKSKPQTRPRFPSSLPFSLPPLYQPNISSTTLIPSTAEGKPIPLDDSTTAHRTSALRELNSAYPALSRSHRYTKSAGASSSTYSQPVIVRTYSGTSRPHAHAHAHAHPSASHRSRDHSRRVPLSTSTSSQPITSTGSVFGDSKGVTARLVNNDSNSHRGGFLGINMSAAGPRAKKRLSFSPPTRGWAGLSLGAIGATRQHDEPAEAKLPPIEAFTFKNLMADMEVGDGESGIGQDLDRIAEICARSRYSLSNQYEVHMAPHGSGESFVPGRQRQVRGSAPGPTLQAVNPDDEQSVRRHRKYRNAGRRRSVAMGTLETIMSSSRSSEEDKSKKKPAAELAEEVRGRAARQASSSSNTSPGRPAAASSSKPGNQEGEKDLSKKKSTSFATAMMDSTRYDISSPRNSNPALHSDPALPQTSSSHLEIRTGPDEQLEESSAQGNTPTSPPISESADTLTGHPTSNIQAPRPVGGLLSGLSTWMPWRMGIPGQGRNSRQAENSLRQLLKGTDAKWVNGKGKAVDRGP